MGQFQVADFAVTDFTLCLRSGGVLSPSAPKRTVVPWPHCAAHTDALIVRPDGGGTPPLRQATLPFAAGRPLKWPAGAGITPARGAAMRRRQGRETLK
jgi:hypothetical protein